MLLYPAKYSPSLVTLTPDSICRDLIGGRCRALANGNARGDVSVGHRYVRISYKNIFLISMAYGPVRYIYGYVYVFRSKCI